MSSATATVAAYVVLGGLGLALQLAGMLAPDRWSTLGRVLAFALHRRSTQVGLVLVWWWLGWHEVTNR